MIFMAIIMILYLKVYPSDANLNVNNHREAENHEIGLNSHQFVFYMLELNFAPEHKEREKLNKSVNNSSDSISLPLNTGISFRDALKTPGIIKYSLVYACIKGSTYGLLFWLPDYLHTIMGFGQV